jgi:hypothetical protein
LPGVVTVLVTFAVVALLIAKELEAVGIPLLLVVSVRPIWLVVAGIFLVGFVLWLRRENYAERLARVSADSPP